MIWFLMMTAFAGDIRMPAKLYGQAVSVKIQLTMPTFTATVPVWINLNLKKSTGVKTVLHELGFLIPGKNFQPLLTEVSDKYFPKFSFDLAKSETAIVPNFAQSCCAGAIGLDFFNQGYLVADFHEPAGIDWVQTGPPTNELLVDTVEVDFSKINFLNLSLSPLSFGKNKWIFRDRVVIYDLQKKKAYIKNVPVADAPMPLVQFRFVPPDRAVQISSLGKDPLSNFLIKSGIRNGMILKKMNGVMAEKISKPDLEWAFYKASKSSKKLELVFSKKIGTRVADWTAVVWPPNN